MSDETIPANTKPKRGPGAPPGGPQGQHGFKKGADPRRSIGTNMRRTKDGKSVTSLAREYTEEALLKQVEIMRDPNTPAREALKAAENIISRGWGAAKQQIEMTQTVEHEHIVSRIDFTAMTQEARLNLLANVRAVPAPTFPTDGSATDASFTLIENNRETDDRD